MRTPFRFTRYVVLAALPALMLAGCKVSKDSEKAESGTEAAAPAAEGDVAKADGAFDISKIPVSTAVLGAFPYITLPEGYSGDGYTPLALDYARYPFWVNGKEHWVEGKFAGHFFVPVQGKQMSEFEVAKNFDAVIKQLGGVEVGQGKVPSDLLHARPEEVKSAFNSAQGDIYNDPVKTWVIRRNDGNIWVQLSTHSAGGGYVVGQEKAFVQTSSLIPASDLKKAIDASGKVALQVNFATDKTDILPDSQPQIDQVVKLLTDDPALKLAINGHTDNTGDKAHNQTLSEGRAKSVVTALTAKGIAANRLTAKGYGDTQPVADNGTQEGKAKNRRVELVKA